MVGIATGLVMGLWSFDGPFAVPTWLGGYATPAPAGAPRAHCLYRPRHPQLAPRAGAAPVSTGHPRQTRRGARDEHRQHSVAPHVVRSGSVAAGQYAMAFPATCVFVAVSLAAWGARGTTNMHSAGLREFSTDETRPLTLRYRTPRSAAVRRPSRVGRRQRRGSHHLSRSLDPSAVRRGRAASDGARATRPCAPDDGRASGLDCQFSLDRPRGSRSSAHPRAGARGGRHRRRGVCRCSSLRLRLRQPCARRPDSGHAGRRCGRLPGCACRGFTGPAASAAVAVLLFTSGSSSTPRAVALTHDNLLANLRSLLSTDLRPEMRCC